MEIDAMREPAAKRVEAIGEFIREQREQAQVSVRQLAKLADLHGRGARGNKPANLLLGFDSF